MIAVRSRKWPDSPHWEFRSRYLGRDEFGHWLGIPTGTPFARPGASFDAPADHVTLVPDGGWFMATFYDPDEPARPVDVYVDVATPATWSPGTVASVDLDLDVVRGPTGRVWVDDEDEFAEHRVTLGYADDLAASALRSCADVLAAVSGGAPPYDGSAARWLRLVGDALPA